MQVVSIEYFTNDGVISVDSIMWMHCTNSCRAVGPYWWCHDCCSIAWLGHTLGISRVGWQYSIKKESYFVILIEANHLAGLPLQVVHSTISVFSCLVHLFRCTWFHDQQISLVGQQKCCLWMVLRFDSSIWPVDPWPVDLWSTHWLGLQVATTPVLCISVVLPRSPF